MNEELIEEIFITIAFKAMDSGKELRLEKGKNTSESNVLGGNFSLSASNYDSLSLLVYDGEHRENVDEDDEDQAEDGE